MTINVNISSPHLSNVDVYNQIVAAFSGASYPIKVRVCNSSKNKDRFPDVGGIFIPPHNNNSNDYVIEKRISLASSSDTLKLAINIDRLAKRTSDAGVLFVIE